MGFDIDLRTLYGIRHDGTSRWISMFPPSYADRACVRNARRRALALQSVSAATPAVDSAAITPAEVNKGAATPPVDAVAQTDMTYCAHECVVHKTAAGAFSVSKGCTIEEEGKKGNIGEEKDKDKGKEEKEKVTEKIRGPRGEEKKAEGKERKKGKGNQKGNARKVDGDQEENNEGSEANSGDELVTKKPDAKQGNEKQQKKQQRDSKRSDAGDAWTPMSCPWEKVPPTFSTPYNGKQWSEHRQCLDHSARLAHEAMQAAKRADEDIAARWIAEQQLVAQQNALRWLQTKYTPNYDRAGDIINYNDLSSHPYHTASENLGRLNSQRSASRKNKHVSFEDPTLRGSRSAPEFSPEPWQVSANPVVVYEENNKMYTPDGHEVVLIAKHGVQGSRPLGSSAHNSRGQPNKGPRNPLQQTSGNVAFHESGQPALQGTTSHAGPPQNHRNQRTDYQPLGGPGRPDNANSNNPSGANDWDLGNLDQPGNQAWASGAIDAQTTNNADYNLGGNNGSNGGDWVENNENAINDWENQDQYQNQLSNQDHNQHSNQNNNQLWDNGDNQDTRSDWVAGENQNCQRGMSNDQNSNTGWPNPADTNDVSNSQGHKRNNDNCANRPPNSPVEPTRIGNLNSQNPWSNWIHVQPNSPANQNNDRHRTGNANRYRGPNRSGNNSHNQDSRNHSTGLVIESTTQDNNQGVRW